ncbi:MAG: ribosome-associated translation inhibitor RaiA [Bacteroidia bacterium]|nr:ribosome-associated translation inhibitor RaiA [Bacteroidia bacterium]
MTIDFQYVNFKADQKLLAYISKKLSKMDTYYDGIVNMIVYLKVINTDSKENKSIEVKANVSNQTLFVSEVSQSFESAVDKVEEKLRTQVQKYKAKQA